MRGEDAALQTCNWDSYWAGQLISLTEHKMVLEVSGYKEELTRYSADCQNET
jgi:hypothetical protein